MTVLGDSEHHGNDCKFQANITCDYFIAAVNIRRGIIYTQGMMLSMLQPCPERGDALNVRPRSEGGQVLLP